MLFFQLDEKSESLWALIYFLITAATDVTLLGSSEEVMQIFITESQNLLRIRAMLQVMHHMHEKKLRETAILCKKISARKFVTGERRTVRGSDDGRVWSRQKNVWIIQLNSKLHV